jgi:TolB-like protein/DNA-binding winged helix-turn-helix (wHTH) protein/tetratricopeptide (TPR) repeat protein
MHKQAQKDFFIDDWRASPAEGLLSRGNETARLEPKAMEVLAYLAARPGEVVTREELERDVWRGALVGYDAVTSTVIKLRKALQDNARQPRYIATIPKKGYQLIASITYPDEDDNPGPVAAVSQDPPGSVQQAEQPRSKQGFGMLLAVLVGIIVLSLVWLWPLVPSPGEENNAALPSIVVLPFDNLGDDPKQDYLADGITEDIITDLSRLSNLLVIASNTSFQYKDRQVTPEKVGTDLNVEFVLKGSIRQLGEEIRVNVQLVNTKTGFNTWAQRYDRNVTEVFAVQDAVTRRIVEALAVKVTNQEKRRQLLRATDNLKAYDFFQEGQKFFKVSTKETHVQAREMYHKAIELDSNYGRAYGAMAVTLINDYRRGWTDTPIETLDRALVLAKKAVALDDSAPQTYWALGFVYLAHKEYDNAERVAEQAISIAPNYADGYGLLALINSYLGQSKKAIELNNKAIRLNPYYSFEYLIIYGIAYYTMGDYDAAITVLEQAQERNENAVHVKLPLAASYVRAGRQDDAEWLVERLQILSPTTTITNIESTTIFANPELKRAFLDDLRKAGLPE